MRQSNGKRHTIRRPKKRKPDAQPVDGQRKEDAGKKTATRTPQNVFEAAAQADSDAVQTWEVEKIVALRWVKGEWQYLVKWADFPDSKNSWEPMICCCVVGCSWTFDLDTPYTPSFAATHVGSWSKANMSQYIGQYQYLVYLLLANTNMC